MQVQYRGVHRSVRPPRAVTLVKLSADWRADAIRMMECYSRTWGGDGNGLAACSADWEIAQPFWTLLTAFDADYWAVFQPTRRGLQISDPTAYQAVLDANVASWTAQHDVSEAEARQIFEADHVLTQPLGGWPPPQELDERIRRDFAPLASAHAVIAARYQADAPPTGRLVDMCQLTFCPERVNLLDVASLPRSVQLLVAARTGALSPSHRAQLAAARTDVRQSAPLADEGLSLLLEFAWTGNVDPAFQRLRDACSGVTGQPQLPEFASSGFLSDTPLAQSRLGCAWLMKWRAGLDDEPAVVICGDTLQDFCYAFTRERTTGHTYWLPTGPGVAEDSLGQALLHTLTKILSSRYARSPSGNRTVLLSSLTLTTSELDAVLEDLRATLWGRHFDDGGIGGATIRVCPPGDLSAPRDLVLLDQVHYGLFRQEPFLGAESAANLEIPIPSQAVGIRPDACRWQVDVLVPDHVLPARWCLNSTVTAADDPAQWAVRSSASGVSVDSHGRLFVFGGSSLSQTLVEVRLRLPPASEIFGTLLAGAGASLHESDKGRYTRRSIELWGDLPTLAHDLRTPATSALLASWAANTINGDDGRIHHKRKYLRLENIAQISGLPTDEARALIDSYVERAIATRGLLLRCELCADTSFYRLEDLGPGFRCQRCRQDNLITRAAWCGSDEPQWFYALDEVVYHALDSNMHVPLLALADLAKPAKSFLYMPEAVVRIEGRDDLEVDLWAIVDGQIVIGEAKKSNELMTTAGDERRRCAALRSLAHAMTADQFVMATSSADWSQRTRHNVDEVIGPVVTVRWLTSLQG